MKTRRSFLKGLGHLIALGMFPVRSSFASSTRFIIIGGGVAGTRAAASLKMSFPTASVVLFDEVFRTEIPGQYHAIQNRYTPLSSDVLDQLDVTLVAASVSDVDPVSKTVITSTGAVYKSDILIVAPGVDFNWQKTNAYYPGLEHQVEHAWTHPGGESSLFRKIEHMRTGDNVVVNIPEAPYRFQAGPYQRVSRIADYLKRYKPESKVIVMDNNNQFPSMDHILDHWQHKYAGNVEWISASSGGVLERIDIQNRKVYSSGESINAGVINVIPAQQAGVIARKAGLSQKDGWCQVTGASLESLHYKDVYIIGDANNADLENKSAVSAARQAMQFVESIRSKVV